VPDEKGVLDFQVGGNGANWHAGELENGATEWVLNRSDWVYFLDTKEGGARGCFDCISMDIISGVLDWVTLFFFKCIYYTHSPKT
jgi:hypothetical protein